MGADGLKWGAGLWIFGGARDRFAVYRDLPTFADMLRMARQVAGLTGIELQYPRHFSSESPEAVQRLCKEAGLEVIGVQPDVFRDPEFRQGALSALDGAVRRRAVDICLEAADAARRVGAPVLVIWPGQEGFDYIFQADYVAQWERALESLRAIADGAKDLKVAVEYKLKEPRQKSLYGTASQTLIAIQEAGRPNLGVLVDFGHSLIAKESPAQAAALLQRCGKLFHVPLNIPLAVWILTGFIGSVPKELEEAAWIDGASFAGTFTRIILPVTINGIIATGIFIFLEAYTHYLLALVVTNVRAAPLTVFIAGQQTDYRFLIGPMLSAAVFGTLPMIVLYTISLKHLKRVALAGGMTF